MNEIATNNFLYVIYTGEYYVKEAMNGTATRGSLWIFPKKIDLGPFTTRLISGPFYNADIAFDDAFARSGVKGVEIPGSYFSAIGYVEDLVYTYAWPLGPMRQAWELLRQAERKYALLSDIGERTIKKHGEVPSYITGMLSACESMSWDVTVPEPIRMHYAEISIQLRELGILPFYSRVEAMIQEAEEGSMKKIIALFGIPGGGKTYARTHEPELKDLPFVDIADVYRNGLSLDGHNAAKVFAYLIDDLLYEHDTVVAEASGTRLQRIYLTAIAGAHRGTLEVRWIDVDKETALERVMKDYHEHPGDEGYRRYTEARISMIKG